MKIKCNVCKVYCEHKSCVFEHIGEENICPFDARYLDLAEHDKQIRAKVIEEYKHNLKETFNNEFPTNFHCTKPYFTLDNVRVLTDAVAREMKEQNNDN